ncbi:hypothetical protein Tco_1460574 [Tanacetum coccineum]
MAHDFSRFTTWTVTSLSRMMDRVGVTDTRYCESQLEYQMRTRRSIDGASTSADLSSQIHDPLVPYLFVSIFYFDLFMHARTKTGSKFSTIVREYVMKPSTLSRSRAELRRESVYKSVEAGRKKSNLNTR